MVSVVFAIPELNSISVLGLNAYHGDASAALFVNGRCLAAAEEERFGRIKHQAGFPALAASWCLSSAGLAPKDLQHVAISRNPSAHISRKVLYSLGRIRSSAGMLKDRLRNVSQIRDTKSTLAEALQAAPDDLGAAFHQVEHHRAHLASAHFCSPLDGPAAVLSLDGMGDFTSTMWGSAADKVEVDDFVAYPHSLGFFYTAFTQFLGMPSYGDEYKLMGLSAYGEDRFSEEVTDVVTLGDDLKFKLNLDYFLHDKQGVEMTWDSGSPKLGRMWSDKMVEVFGPPREPYSEASDRDADLALSVQRRLETLVLEMLRRLHRKTGTKSLVMAGGVALNCVANGMIRSETPFEEVWIQPAANDSGTAIGAALWVQHQLLGEPRRWTMDHAYLGPSFDDVDYKRALEGSQLGFDYLPDEALYDKVTSRIAEGAVVGWFQGAMEFGPRALGNRSIVCDPRRHDMKDILNSRIKHREPFRPFAPSILAEETGAWFEDSYPSPYMLMAYKVRPEKRSQIPAVTHEDGTGRLQTVDSSANPRYHALISSFGRKTGVPILLNTSFNENEPICCRPEEAIDCFKRTKMDVLVLGNYVVDRGQTEQA